MLGPHSEWVQNVGAANGDAVIRRGRAGACISYRCRQRNARPSCASTSASRRAAVNISRFRLAHRSPSSRRSRDVIPFTGSTLVETKVGFVEVRSLFLRLVALAAIGRTGVFVTI